MTQIKISLIRRDLSTEHPAQCIPKDLMSSVTTAEEHRLSDLKAEMLSNFFLLAGGAMHQRHHKLLFDGKPE